MFTKGLVGDSPNIWKKVLWSDETNVAFWPSRKTLCLAQTPHLSSPSSCHCFSSAGTGKLVRIEGMMDGAKYREILEGNLFQSSRDLRLGQRFTFQQDNNPKHTVKATLGWFKGKHLNV